MSDSNQNVKIILVTAIICIVLCIPLGLLIGKVLLDNNDSSNMPNNNQNQTNSENNNANGDTNNSESNKQVCEGFKDAIYKGEYHKNGLNEYLTLTLKKDGTFTASYKDSEANSGNYTISNNILTTTFCPNYQPCDEKIVLSYNITSDCSTIVWGEPEYYQYNIYLK